MAVYIVFRFADMTICKNILKTICKKIFSVLMLYPQRTSKALLAFCSNGLAPEQMVMVRRYFPIGDDATYSF